MIKQEIGGYFGTEHCRSNIDRTHLIEGAVKSHCAYFNKQNAGLNILIKVLNLTTIWIPAYICPSVHVYCEDICQVRYYHLDDQFKPLMTDLEDGVLAGDAVLLVNYFGIQDKEMDDLVTKLDSLKVITIVDCAHALYYSGGAKYI